MPTGTTDATISGDPRREDEVELLARLVADALKDSVMELQKVEEEKMSQFTSTFLAEFSALRNGEEGRIARLEKAIADLKPPPSNTDPTTNFWTVYKNVADEHDNDLVSKYAGDLDNSLLFAGLFSAVTTTFIVQLIPQLQPDPVDLTNALLLRILQQNASFGGANPLAPIANISAVVVRAQSILFASLCITLVVAFIAVLGKQWILYYTRATTWGNIVDRGKERQVKLVGLQKWGLHLIMESLPVMLQFALLLFAIALAVYLWDLNVSIAEVVLGAASVGLVFYACITVAATIWSDCPFQTPLSVILPKVLPWAKDFTALVRVWLKQKTASILLRIERMAGHGRLRRPLGRLFKTFTGEPSIPNNAGNGAFSRRYPMTFSNPTFWREGPLFTSSIPKDISASAGFWLLENSTDFSAASAVAAVFSEIQWPSHYHSTTALIRLRDTYVECFRAPEFNKPTRLKALQSAAAYYVLYHTQLIWSTLQSFEVEVEVKKLPHDLPPDLLHIPSDEWGGDDVFEYLLHTQDRSEPVTSARFLSYIAPYWFCGDSDATIKFRPSRLQQLSELIEVLENSHALTPATVTDCVLCAGAVMDFPLHPDDLVRVDKSGYFAPTFKMVVEHIHGIVLAGGRRRRHAEKALEILVTLVRKTTLPLVDAAWINELLKRAAGGSMDNEKFTLFMRLSARRKEEESTADMKAPSGQEYVHADGNVTYPPSNGGAVLPRDLFSKIMHNVRTCIEKEGGWRDEAVYGGLIAIRDISGLGTCLPTDGFLQALSKALEKEETNGENKYEIKPFRVRKAAYDVVVAARDGWLRSAELRPVLENLDIPRKLHSVVIEAGRSDNQRSFLETIEILSEDRCWHPYLRKALDIWLPFHHEGLDRVLRILTTVGELLTPGCDSSKHPLDKFFEKLVEDEWARVPGRPVQDLTADRLKPLAEVTEQLKEHVFTESDRRAILGVVEQVIPSLEKRRDDGYEGPGEDICGVVDNLLGVLRSPVRSTRRRPTNW